VGETRWVRGGGTTLPRAAWPAYAESDNSLVSAFNPIRISHLVDHRWALHGEPKFPNIY
jgi:hypothetical protein